MFVNKILLSRTSYYVYQLNNKHLFLKKNKLNIKKEQKEQKEQKEEQKEQKQSDLNNTKIKLIKLIKSLNNHILK